MGRNAKLPNVYLLLFNFFQRIVQNRENILCGMKKKLIRILRNNICWFSFEKIMYNKKFATLQNCILTLNIDKLILFSTIEP